MRRNTDRISLLGSHAGRGGRLGALAITAALCGCVITLNPGDDSDTSATGAATSDDDATAGSTATTTGDSDGSTTGTSSPDGETATTTATDSVGSDSDSDSDDSDSDSAGESGGDGVCGDGIVDPGEACDDGDLDDHDACLSTCEVAVCGDGIVQLGVEACDDGNAVDDDQCSSTCVRATCGDGIRNGDESGVDCGGKCSACEIGEACNDGIDCVTGSCAAGLCVSARHCADVLALGVGDSDGVYVIDGDGPAGGQPPVEVYCEMSLEGGGWTAIYNRGDAVASFAEAAAFEASLATLADAEVIYPWSESQAVHSGGLDLSLYHEALFAWEPVDTLDPTRYAILTREEGLAGLCVVDGPCPGATSLGAVDVFPSGDVVEVFTGDPQHWPQIGLGVGVGDQTILWGYDRDGSVHGNWANWFLEGPLGVAGNTPEIAAASWRYAIYIR